MRGAMHRRRYMGETTALPCPNCGAGLRFIEEYGRQYCDACGQYAPDGYGGGGALSCPKCGGVLAYIKDYNRYFCYKDQEYPAIEATRTTGAPPAEPEPEPEPEIPWIDDFLPSEPETEPPPEPPVPPAASPPPESPPTSSDTAPPTLQPETISADRPASPVSPGAPVAQPTKVVELPKPPQEIREPGTDPSSRPPSALWSPPTGASSSPPPTPPQIPAMDARPQRTLQIARPPLVRDDILRAKKASLMDLATAYGLDSVGSKETLRERLFAELVKVEKEEERRAKEEREKAEKPPGPPVSASAQGAPLEVSEPIGTTPVLPTPSTPVEEAPVGQSFIPSPLPEEPAPAATPEPPAAAIPAFPEAPSTPILPEGTTAEAEASVSEPVTSEPSVVPAAPRVINPCPTCGRELSYIEQYDRYYCHNCRAYAPPVVKVEAVPAPPRIGKPCPTCGRELTYIPDYSRHYCYNCKKYAPLEGRGAAPRPSPSVEMIPPKPESAPAPPPTVEIVAVKNPCPTCGRELSFIEKYGRYYCYSCRKYAPARVKNPCPNCGKELTYIAQYSRHYCPSCGQYAPREMTVRILAARASGVATSPAVFARGATATRTVAVPIHRHGGSPMGAIALSATGLIVLLMYEFLWAMPQAFGAGPSYLGLDSVTAPAVGFIVQLIGFLMIGLGVIVGLFLLRTPKG